jgi:hypothetical protein
MSRRRHGVVARQIARQRVLRRVQVSLLAVGTVATGALVYLALAATH